ncbi:MAG: cupin domain-containing protein [Burkholderiaceae bacterium]|jgi:quercetin dioxygenase-like cupin family protein|nr:cupin domain-containing protein [Burkholderiaceae bacterium]
MSTQNLNPPMPIRPPPEPTDGELAPLLSEPFALAWDQPAALAVAPHVRGRLLQRLAASRVEEALMHTARRRRLPRQTVAPGVVAQELYAARKGVQPRTALRPGEPTRARLIELAPGARLLHPPPGGANEARALHREWLVLSGDVRIDSQVLSQRDYHVTPAGFESPELVSAGGALLFLRESRQAAQAGDAPTTVRDSEAGWSEFAPGIQRRVLWHRDGQAAMLYFARPGAQVPRHTHGHDEECLMVQGELFLDDLLLQPGDYQLAPAGTGHRITETDTGVVIYAHGDLDLKFVA